MIIQVKTENQSKAVNDMKSQSQLNFFTNVMEPQLAVLYRMTMMGMWLMGRATNCLQKLYFRSTRVVGKMVLEGGTGRRKDLMNKTACESCLNMFIFSVPFTC